ncbi:MAG: serine hydrolase, partial [Acidobacteriota bacterium]
MDNRLYVAGWVHTILLLGLMSLLPTVGCAPRHPSIETRIEGVTNGLFSWPLLEQMKADHVPGVSIAVIDGKQIEWSRGFGVTNVEDGSPVDETTMFQASSISKAVTAAVA